MNPTLAANGITPVLRKFFLFITLGATAVFCNAQNGRLDTTFSYNRGTVITHLDQGASEFRASCINADGTIIAAGSVYPDGFVLMKFKPNGRADSSFGTRGDGIVITNVRYAEDHCFALALQPDGKLIAAGSSTDMSGENIALVRYNPNGTVDSSFGLNGAAIGVPGAIKHVALRDDGKIVADVWNLDVMACTLYNSNGTVDSSFGQTGICKIPYDNIEATPASITSFTLLPGNKIIAAGVTHHNVDGVPGTVIAKFSAYGRLDSSFGTNGIVKIINKLSPYAVKVNSLNKIIVGGIYQDTAYWYSRLGIAQFLADGTPDSSFGVNGVVVNRAILRDDDDVYCNDIVIEPGSNKIIACGYITTAIAPGMLLAKYLPDGNIDTAFADSGTMMLTTRSYLYGLTLQPDGKIIAVGKAWPYDFYEHEYLSMLIARFNNTVQALPVKLLSFTAEKSAKGVMLQWQTASESNSDYFAVERSSGNGFATIGRVKSAGNSTALHPYSFIDAGAYAGKNYYRLRQVDRDGRAEFSKTVIVDLAPIAQIKIMPNPVANFLYVQQLDASAPSAISIIDMNGKTLQRATVTGSSCSLNIKTLAGGYYIVKVQNGQTATAIKILKR